MLAAHSPDNSFMGFVVERHVETPTMTSNVSDVIKKNQAVVYGKAEYMWSVSIHSVISLQLTNFTFIQYSVQYRCFLFKVYVIL